MTKELNPHFDPKKKNIFFKYLSLIIGSILLLDFFLVLTGYSTGPFTIIGFETGKLPYMFFYLVSGGYLIWSGFTRYANN
ncbi:MAG: hypothetical protein EA390_10725 [Balneolaceae bacterium]|nr:MAG: hypothetical protein EA390_10725 [Balneolaceae bacterium]